MHFNNKTHYAQVYILMEICATMTLQSCQLIGVAEGLTISYPNFLKLYISRGFILLSTLARLFAKLALMRKKIAKFQHGATIAPWFLIGRMPLTLYSTIQNSLFGSCTLSHVTNNSDTCTVRASIAWQI